MGSRPSVFVAYLTAGHVYGFRSKSQQLFDFSSLHQKTPKPAAHRPYSDLTYLRLLSILFYAGLEVYNCTVDSKFGEPLGQVCTYVACIEGAVSGWQARGGRSRPLVSSYICMIKLCMYIG